MRATATPQDARPGDSLFSEPRRSGFAEWNRFAAVNDEFVPIHMDDEAGQRAGYPGAIGMGRLQWSYVHAMLREWLGDEGRIAEVSLQFRSPVLKDALFECRGNVTSVRANQDEKVIDCKIWIEDEDAKVLAPGTATVIVPVA